MPETNESHIKYVLKQDVLSAIPFVNSVYKVNFGVTRDMANCAVAITGGTLAMWLWYPAVSLQDAAVMSGVMTAGMTTFKIAFNLGCRAASSATNAILFRYNSLTLAPVLNADPVSEISLTSGRVNNSSIGPAVTL